jgi:hypothetical protein
MKKIILFLALVVVFVSCKDDFVKKPNNLIEKEVMVNIMYDLSILEAIKYQSPASIEKYKINPTQYILKKYKVDSLQFAKSSMYYAADYKEYKKMYEQVSKRLDKNKAIADTLVKREKKKMGMPKGAIPAVNHESDSLKKIKENKLDL